ncbi:MAG: hypothetical protein QM728_02760 [Gordonia sp. (in: high G+C Gram-positive bacteria)]|uniref:hypothetical protein n=1 Tax=Gordonia sp. (in: high G+C Gram-positive bacteria) TaxID=84139 RepID=UPI0039E4721A
MESGRPLPDEEIARLIARCGQTAERWAQGGDAGPWDAAVAACRRGDGRSAAELLAGLGEGPRFVATAALGIAFPAVHADLAQAYDQSVPPGVTAVEWSDWSCHRFGTGWAASTAHLDPGVVLRLCRRSGVLASGAALLAATRSRLVLGDVAGARLLADGIDEYDKEDRAVAHAVLLIVTGNPEFSAQAVRSAVAEPIIQAGGEEAGALAAVLAEYAAARLPAGHLAVVEAVTKLVSWTERRFPGDRDARLASVLAAAKSCVRAGWTDHAHALADCVHDEQARTEIDGVIVSGIAPDDSPPPVREPDLAEIREEAVEDSRMRLATERADARFSTGDHNGALAAIGAFFTPTVEPDKWDRARARDDWALALARGGSPERAAAILLEQIGEGTPTDTGWAAAHLLPPPQARQLVEAGLDHGWATAIRWTQSRPYSGTQLDPPVAAELIRMATRTDDEELADRVVTAALGHDPSTMYRDERVELVLRLLGDARPDWFEVVHERLDDHDLALAVSGRALALARRGELPEALRTAAKCAEPRIHHQVLLRIAEISPDPTVARAFAKSKKGGNDHDYRGAWLCNRGIVELRCGQVDDAIATAAEMPDVRITGVMARDLVTAIVAALTAQDAWSPERVQALADTAAGQGVDYWDMPGLLAEVGPTIVAHHPDRSLAAARQRLSSMTGGWPFLDGVEAVGRAVGGDSDGVHDALCYALDAAKQESGDIDPALWTRVCAQLPPDFPERAGFLGDSVRLLRQQSPDAATRSLRRMFAHLDAGDAWLPDVLVRDEEFPAATAHAVDDCLGEFVADRGDDSDNIPLERSADPVAADRRLQQAARYLARRGAPAAADHVARLSSLGAAAG